MSLSILLAISGGLEASGGALTLVAPAVVVNVLLGTAAEPVTVALARFFGAGILSLGLAALLARHNVESDAGMGVIYAMTCYNLVAALLLIWAVAVVGLGGVILWGAGLGHAALGLLLLRGLITVRIATARIR